jgi:uncharacterized protein YuzE
MKIEYTRSSDALYVYFKEAYVEKSKEIEDGVVVDFDKNGCIIGIEILNATDRFSLSDLVNINIENLPLDLVKTS